MRDAKEAAMMTREKTQQKTQLFKDELNKWITTVFPKRLTQISGEIEGAINKGRYWVESPHKDTADQIWYMCQYLRELGYKVEPRYDLTSQIESRGHFYYICWK